MRSIQEEFNLSSGDFLLTPGEYQGPLVIRRPCVFDGGQSTLWADKGPVLLIASPGVTIRNLRVEVTGSAGGTAIQITAPHACLENVEASGNVTGLSGEPEDCRLPPAISLGEFSADQENVFSLELETACRAELLCGLRDVAVFPQELSPGKNHVLIKTGPMRDNTILYGEILVRTSVTRRIYLTGKALIGAPNGRMGLPLPVEYPSGPAPAVPPPEIVAPAAEYDQIPAIARGQRLPAGELQEGVLKLAYEHQYADPAIEIDGYVFLLKDGGKVRSDQDLIFFGNPDSKGVQVRSSSGRPLVLVELPKVEAWVERIAVCCSIYGDNPRQNFSQVDGPVLRIFRDSAELYRFPLSELRDEKTVVAVEIYRYKGEWKLNFVGAGFRSGLKQLCEGYGVEVE